MTKLEPQKHLTLLFQLDDQLEYQFGNILLSRLENQLDSQLEDQLGNQLYEQLYDQLNNLLESQLKEIKLK